MSATMMALVRRGNQARLEERPVPALLDGRDALVRVTLSTICTSDLHILHGAVPRARDGVVLGHEFVGEVVAVGERPPTASPSAGTAGSAARGISTTANAAAGNWAAASTAARRNMSVSPSPTAA